MILKALVAVVCSFALAVQARSQQASEEETRLIQEFARDYVSSAVGERRQAVIRLSESSRSSPELESSKQITTALASALGDIEDDVALDALVALKDGRHVATASAATSAYLVELCSRIVQITHASGMDGDKNLVDMEKPNRNSVMACECVAQYGQLDGQQALVKSLPILEEVAPGRGAFYPCEEAIVDSLIRYATKDALEAIVGHMRSYDTLSSRKWLDRIDAKLRAFCGERKLALPPLDPEASNFKIIKMWRLWADKNVSKLGQYRAKPKSVK